MTEEQIHGLLSFLRSGCDGIEGGEVCFVRAWIEAMTSFSIGCLTVEPMEIEAVLDALEHVVEFGELALAAKAASQLARFERDQVWLVATAVGWMREPEKSLASRPWRSPYFDGVLVAKNRVDVASELTVDICVAGASLADTLLESGALVEAEREALLHGIRNCTIPLEDVALRF